MYPSAMWLSLEPGFKTFQLRLRVQGKTEDARFKIPFPAGNAHGG
ncbi:hypothetical protein LEMLEM_LOCUS8455 [Lemmus lemmus]